MLYFITAPVKYRKILFGLRDYSETRKETLLDYSLRTYRHLIPNGLSFSSLMKFRARLILNID